MNDLTNVILGLASGIKASGIDISIGLRSAQSESGSDQGTWTWTDGTALDYTLWAQNEPKNTGGPVCVRMKNSVPKRSPNYARWEVVDCSSKQRTAVCKQPVDFEFFERKR